MAVPKQAKRPRGRPAAPESKRRGQNVTLRFRADLKKLVETRAEASGRSLSAEAEAMLEQAAFGDGMLDQALDLAFGRRSAGMLLLIGRLMHETSIHGDHVSLRRTSDSPNSWLSDPFIFEQVRGAITQALHAVRPTGDPKAVFGRAFNTLGLSIANGLLSAVAELQPIAGEQGWYEKIRERLGPEVIDRIAHREGANG